MSRGAVALLIVATALIWPSELFAHDVPTDVLVQAFVKPEGQRLNMLVRVPLRAILDVDIPKRGPGYLDLERAEGSLREGATGWIAGSVELYENGARLANERIVTVRVSLPSDASFRSYDEALAHIRAAPLPPDTELYWEQGMLDVWLEYPIQSDQSHLAIRPTFWRLGLRVHMTLRSLPISSAANTFEVGGDPGLIALDPTRGEAGRRFGQSGLLYVLGEAGQLLFLLCLVIPIRRLATLIPVVASLIVGYSTTLVASAYGLAPSGAWFPPLLNTLLAASVIYLACENISGWRIDRRVTSFSFGLLFGFGFSLALRDNLQFAGGHLPTAVLSFNVGIALGHLVVIAVLVAGLGLLFQLGIDERVGGGLLSALAIHPSWHQTGERGIALMQFSWLDVALLSGLVRWTTVMVALVGVSWFVFSFLETASDQQLEHPVAEGKE